MTIEQDAANLKRDFETHWGAFRRWLSKHPLTGFWLAVIGGLLVGFGAGRVF